jgi:uncharacterized protein (DUF427 family)
MKNPARMRLPLGPGQESVWDYPRPPRVETVAERIVIECDGRVIVDTTEAIRVLETSHPPAYYLLRSDFLPGVLIPAEGKSFCEYKGLAEYLSVGSAERAAWFYPEPSVGYEILANRVSLYPGMMDRCTINGETVTGQEGGFYGGWITAKIVGPFKGAPGTLGW